MSTRDLVAGSQEAMVGDPSVKSREFLTKLMGSSVSVQIVDGRTFAGSLLCTDGEANIVMGSCIEYPPPGTYEKDDLSMAYDAGKVCGVVSLYWFVSISLVFANKWLLSNSDVLFDAPLFITWFQCLCTVALCGGLSYASYLYPGRFSFTAIDFSFGTALKILPLTTVFFAMIVCNNFCLKYLDVSFYFVARSLTTIFNVILTYVVLKKTTTLKALLCCGVIILGYIASVLEENGLGSLSVSGLIFGVSASFAVALFSIMTSKGLAHVGDNIWKLTFYNNLNSSLLFIIGILLTSEFKEFQYLPPFFSLMSLLFWSTMLVSGVFGFAISYVTAWQIQVTSPLTHNISGTAKAAAQTLLAALIALDFKSPLWWVGNCLVVTGSMAYAYVRHQLSVQAEQANAGDLKKVTAS